MLMFNGITYYEVTSAIRGLLTEVAIDRTVNKSDSMLSDDVADRLGICVHNVREGLYYTIVNESAYTMTLLRISGRKFEDVLDCG